MDNTPITADEVLNQPAQAPAQAQPSGAISADEVLGGNGGASAQPNVPIIVPPNVPAPQPYLPKTVPLPAPTEQPAATGQNFNPKFGSDILSSSVTDKYGTFPTKPFSGEDELAANAKKVSDLDAQTLAAVNKAGLNTTNQTSIPTDETQTGTNNIGFGTRLDLGLSTSGQTTADTFHQHFPDGDVMQNTPDGSTLYRTDKSQPWVRLSPNTQQKMLEFRNIFAASGTYTAEQRTDAAASLIKGLVIDNPKDVAVAAITAIFLHGTPGLIGTVVGLTGGNMAVGTADNLYQTTRGRDANYGKDALNDFFNGLIQAGTVGVTKLPGAATSVYSGKPVFKLTPERLEFREAFQRLKNMAIKAGVEGANDAGIMAHQMTENPLVNRIAKMTGNVVSDIRDAIKSQQELVAKTLQGQIDPGALAAAPKAGEALETEGKDYALNTAGYGGASNPGVSSKTAGDAVNKELSTYAQRSQAQLNKLYDARNAIEEPIYSPRAALDAADEAEKGVVQQIPGQPTTKVSPLVDAKGDPISQVVPGQPTENQLEKLPSDLKEAVSDIRNWEGQNSIRPAMNPDGTLRNTSTDQIRAIQAKVFPWTQPDATGANPAITHIANKLYQGLQAVLDNPLNDGKAFQDANTAARTAAAQRFQALKNPLIRQGYQQELDEMLSTPEARMSSLASGKGVTLLDRIKNLAPQSYPEVINQIHTKLFDNMDSLSRTMKKLNGTSDGEEFANRIFPDKATQDAYTQLGKDWDSINELGLAKGASGVSKAPAEAENAGARFMETILNGPKDTIQGKMDTLATLIQHNPNSEMASSVRAGIFNNLINKARTVFKGESSINYKAFDKVYDSLTDDAQMRFLTDQDKQLLKDSQTVLHWTYSSKGDIGTGFQGGELASQFMHDPLNHELALSILEHWRIGKLFTRPVVQRVLYGVPDTVAGQTMPNPLAQKIIQATQGLPPEEPSSLPRAMSNFIGLLAKPAAIINPVGRMLGTQANYSQYTKSNLKEQTDKNLEAR